MIGLYFQRLSLAIDRRSLRERVAIMVAVGAVLIVAWYILLIEPMDKANSALEDSNTATRNTVESLEQTLETLVAENTNDPDEAVREQLAALSDEIEQLEQRLSKVATDIIAPRDIPKVLGRVLQNSPGITLLEMRNRPPAPVNLGIAAESGNSGMSRAYRHGVVMTVRGNYADITDYVRAIENLDWTVLWSSVHLRSNQTANSPEITGELELYTLSLDQEWMGV